jgi:hypothetical protein
MGSWAADMRGSDDALDAVDTYKKKLETIDRRPAALTTFFKTVYRRFGAVGALGVAEEMLEMGIDLRALKSLLAGYLKEESAPDVLVDWEDMAAARRKALKRFGERLAKKPPPPKIKKPVDPSKFRVPPKFQKGKKFHVPPNWVVMPEDFPKDGLLEWEMGKRKGYFNRDLTIVIPPIFTEACHFSDGRAAVAIGERWGLIDTQGQWVIPPEFSFVNSVGAGRVMVRDTQDREGLADKDGRILLQPTFGRIERFSEGLALVEKKNRYGFIDRDGKIVVPLTLQEASSFRNGTAKARSKEGLWGRMDRTGRWVEQAVASEQKPGAEGLTPSEIGGKWGYLDAEGLIAIKPQFADADPFDQGLARVCFGEGLKRRYGLIDKKGRFIVPAKYSVLGQFSDDLARVEVKGKEGFMNRKGRLAIPAIYDEVIPFEKGTALAKHKGLWGRIDAQGKTVVPFVYEALRESESGLAAARQKGLWGYLNSKGGWAIPPQFHFVRNFNGLTADVQVKTGKSLKWRTIDKTGAFVGRELRRTE